VTKVRRLAELRWPEAAGVDLLVVPVGSTEQHGPHLPLATDAIVAAAVAERLVAALVEDGVGAVLGPTVPYGASGEHEGFPGTVSIGHGALRALLVELVRSASAWAPRTLLVNGHGGNAPTLDAVVALLESEGRPTAWLPCGVRGADAHAGRAETSLLLQLRPDLVALDAAEPGAVEPIAGLLPRLRAEGVRAVAPNGVLGDPTGASAAEGAALLRAMVASATERARGFVG